MKKILIILFFVFFSIAVRSQTALNLKPGTIVFIHGMFLNDECWKDWIAYYESKGYKCIAPPWPYHNKTVEELRKAHPNKQLGMLTLDSVLVYYEKLIRSMSEPPILIGHSMGGLLVELLINKGFGACGVAIDAAPPHGVKSYQWSFLKSNFPVINPLAGNSPYCMSFRRFRYAFVNGLPQEQQKELYRKYAVPESRNIARSSAKMAKINFNDKQQPLLIIAGEKDHIIPSVLNRKTYEKYSKSNSKVDFKEFPGRNHLFIAEDGWKEVADYILDWVHKTDLIIASPVSDR